VCKKLYFWSDHRKVIKLTLSEIIVAKFKETGAELMEKKVIIQKIIIQCILRHGNKAKTHIIAY
jgi:hypothetical protein